MRLAQEGASNSFKNAPVSLPAFVFMLEGMMAHAPASGITTSHAMMWCFALMTWCRLVRRASTATVTLEHLSHTPGSDHFKLCIPLHETLQLGESGSDWNIDSASMFSNPHEPAMNVHLALAVHHFAYPPSPEPGSSIWGVKTPDTAFSKHLAAILDSLSQDAGFIKLLGDTSIDFVASHSIRKSVITYLTSMCDGADFIAILNRAGFALPKGGVNEYMKGVPGQDPVAAR